MRSCCIRKQEVCTYSSPPHIFVVSIDRTSWSSNATRQVENEVGVGVEILEIRIAQLGLKANLHLTVDTTGLMSVIKEEEEADDNFQPRQVEGRRGP